MLDETSTESRVREEWVEVLSDMSSEELSAFLTPEEKTLWIQKISNHMPDTNKTTVGEVLTNKELRELLADVLEETRGDPSTDPGSEQ
jgi:hypothetical protein